MSLVQIQVGPPKQMFNIKEYDKTVSAFAATLPLDIRRILFAKSPSYKLALKKDPCSYCGGKATTLDHIVPRCEEKNDCWANLTACCYRCNQAKADTDLLFFLVGVRHELLGRS